MNAVTYVKFINMYLVFAGALTLATAYFIYNPSYFLRRPLETVLLAGGWVVSTIIYVTVILLIRVCIYQTVNRLRSPLDM